MNILHISPYVPSVHASHAGGVCMGKELEALRKKHNVFVLSFINDEKEEKLVEKEFKNDSRGNKGLSVRRMFRNGLYLHKH